MRDIIANIRELSLLYIEDDPIVRATMAEMLNSIFNAITISKNGEEGLELYNSYYRENSSYYDLIITDISMPKLDGDKMSQIILSINPNQSIVAMTAYSQRSSLEDLKNIGIKAVIKKPMVLQELLEVIDGLKD